LRHDPWPVLSGAKPAIAANQFDLDRPLNPASPEPVLYVCDRTVPERLSYSEIETLPPIEAVTGPHSARRFAVFKLSGARGEAAPINPSSR